MRILLAALLVCGCGEETISADVACADYVKALCGQLNTCGPPLVKIAYGDQATCELRLKPSCLLGLKDPGTTLTTNRLDACAKKFMTQSCTALFNHTVVDECKATPGALADGTPCGDDNQCKSAFCRKSVDGSCGVCGTRTGTCQRNDDCESGSICAASTCLQRAAQGAACNENLPCSYGLICDGGTCKTPPGVGMSCTPDLMGGNCDRAQGYICNASSLCQSVMYAKAGDACGLVGQNYFLCTTGSICSGQLTGNCVAPAADGAACDAVNGPTCLAPADCINSICTLPDTSTCK